MHLFGRQHISKTETELRVAWRKDRAELGIFVLYETGKQVLQVSTKRFASVADPVAGARDLAIDLAKQYAAGGLSRTQLKRERNKLLLDRAPRIRKRPAAALVAEPVQHKPAASPQVPISINDSSEWTPNNAMQAKQV